MSECEACGQEKVEAESIQEVFEKAVDEALKGAKDKVVYGVACRCTECERRLDPTDKIAVIHGKRTVEEMSRDGQTDEPNFLEEQSLTYGME